MTFSLGNVGFNKKPVTSAGDVPEAVRFRTIEAKYPEKLLGWRTISEKGISEPFFIPIKASLTGSKYWEDHWQIGNIFIWPNLARCHYSNETQELFNKLEIPFIPHGSNPRP